MTRRVEIGILGPLRVTVDDREVRLPAKQQVLLTLLALDRGTVSTERLLTALWGEDAAPGTLRTLQSHVFQLRRALAGGIAEAATSPDSTATEPTTIETDGRGYRLRREPDAVDAQRFEALLDEARRVDRSESDHMIELLSSAIGLWRGHELPDVGGEAIATAELERLAELRHNGFDDLARLRIANGEATQLIPELRRELRTYPYREPLWGSLMLALDRSGRKAEALLAYREATETLRRELDVAPDPHLVALAERIRTDVTVHAVASTMPLPARVGAPPGSTAPLAAPPDGAARRMRPGGLRLAGLAAAITLVVVSVRLLPSAGSGAGSSMAPGALATDRDAAAAGIAILDADGTASAGTPLSVRPEGIASGAGSLWVTSPTDGTVLRVDPASHAVIQRIGVGGGPTGVTTGFGAVWVADSSDRSVARIDPATDQVVAHVEVGTAPEGLATDAHSVWVTDRLDHAITRIDPTDGSTTSFALGTSPVAVAVAAGWIWVADAGDSDVVQIDPSTGTVVRTIAVGSDPNAIAASPTGDAVWVANTGSGTVFRIDTATSTVTAAQAVGPAPTGIAVDGRNVWVAVSGADQVVQLDPTTATITDTIAMSGSPRSIALTDGRVAVTTSAPAGSHRGGTLHVLIPGTISDTADPTYSEWYYGGIWALTNDALVARARVGGPGGLVYVPDLAIAVPDAQDGGRTWTFRLRPGLVYSDGRPVRASDALGSFERAVLAGNAAQTGAGMFRDTSIVGSAACGTAPPCDLSAGITTDDAAGTITFHLVAPVGDFPTRIGSVPIVPAGTPLTLSPVPLVATGPYMVAAFISGTREELVRNPRFSEWSHDAQPDGEVDTMEFEGTNDPDPTTTVLAGTADVLTVGAEPAGRLASIATQEPAQLRITPSNQVWDEAMNTTLAPFDDQDVRQAVNLATDRAALVDAWGGPLTATITCQVLPSGFAGFQRYCPWTVDPSSNGNWLGPDVPRAQALIAAAGVRGQAVTVWGLDGDGQHAAVARYFTGLLTSLGFRATMHLLPYDQYFSFIAEHPEQVQMAGYWDESAERTAAEAIPGAFTCPADPGYPYNGQPSEWCDPSVDAQVQSAEALESSDPIAADDEWARIDRSIVDAAPGVLAFDPTSVTLLSARTGGYEYDPVLGVLYGDLWVR